MIKQECIECIGFPDMILLLENFLLSMNVFDTMCHHQILKYSKTINQIQRKDYTVIIYLGH